MNLLSKRVLDITTEYLGPGAERFLERQTRSHMDGVEFSAIQRSDMPDLIKWVNISAGLLIGKERAAELTEKLKKI
ncbi:hypothetical protein Metli_0061 [Methanofollis liminatans DSM 4140]|jgi:hypothetical protein|uniref:Uncharacterized protein n=1 Tax=Methanofollis liminatans DSM 4140 TaxID=28892 RepID=J0S690_9EURY|nr:hypothetical protein [Methanofollis liminatans]EJG06039.1 hypothetical protein Metli_0061 [Methanofollis liminatans DSM 4140]